MHEIYYLQKDKDCSPYRDKRQAVWQDFFYLGVPSFVPTFIRGNLQITEYASKTSFNAIRCWITYNTERTAHQYGGKSIAHQYSVYTVHFTIYYYLYPWHLPKLLTTNGQYFFFFNDGCGWVCSFLNQYHTHTNQTFFVH